MSKLTNLILGLTLSSVAIADSNQKPTIFKTNNMYCETNLNCDCEYDFSPLGISNLDVYNITENGSMDWQVYDLKRTMRKRNIGKYKMENATSDLVTLGYLSQICLFGLEQTFSNK